MSHDFGSGTGTNKRSSQFQRTSKLNWKLEFLLTFHHFPVKSVRDKHQRSIKL